MKMTFLGWLLVPAFVFLGCTERDLDYRAASGRVEIAPVWDDLPRPSSACYRFYGEDDRLVSGEGATSASDASVDFFSVVLPVGRYRCLAYNTDAQGVTFTGLDNRTLAEVRLSSDAQPDNVYSWSVDEVEVASRGDVRYTPVPLRLVKQVVLRFRVTGVEGATVLNGTLNGVYPALFLLSGDPPEQSIRTAPETVAKYTATLVQTRTSGAPSYTASADIRLLGLLNPQKEEGAGGGTVYDSRLNLSVHNSSGEVYSTTVNMNKPVSEIIDSYGGEIPIDKTIEIDVSVNLLDMNLTAVVQGWTEGNREIIIIK